VIVDAKKKANKFYSSIPGISVPTVEKWEMSTNPDMGLPARYDLTRLKNYIGVFEVMAHVFDKWKSAGCLYHKSRFEMDPMVTAMADFVISI